MHCLSFSCSFTGGQPKQVIIKTSPSLWSVQPCFVLDGLGFSLLYHSLQSDFNSFKPHYKSLTLSDKTGKTKNKWSNTSDLNARTVLFSSSACTGRAAHCTCECKPVLWEYGWRWGSLVAPSIELQPTSAPVVPAVAELAGIPRSGEQKWNSKSSRVSVFQLQSLSTFFL